MLVREIPKEERPREKAIRYGVEALSNRELLAVLLRTGIKGHPVMEVAEHLLEKADGIKGIARMNRQDLCAISGISSVKAVELQASMELSRRILFEQALEDDAIRNPEHLIRWLRRKFGGQQQEHFIAVYLDSSNRIIRSSVLFIGTLNASMVSPREVMAEALKNAAASMILAHNHPSGNPLPSDADLASTARICKAAKLLDINVLDHLIVTSIGHFSFAREGLLEKIQI